MGQKDGQHTTEATRANGSLQWLQIGSNQQCNRHPGNENQHDDALD